MTPPPTGPVRWHPPRPHLRCQTAGPSLERSRVQPYEVECSFTHATDAAAVDEFDDKAGSLTIPLQSPSRLSRKNLSKRAQSGVNWAVLEVASMGGTKSDATSPPATASLLTSRPRFRPGGMPGPMARVPCPNGSPPCRGGTSEVSPRRGGAPNHPTEPIARTTGRNPWLRSHARSHAPGFTQCAGVTPNARPFGGQGTWAGSIPRVAFIQRPLVVLTKPVVFGLETLLGMMLRMSA